MALTGEEIRARLLPFAARWSEYKGSERSEAQTFLNELFECYGQSRQAVATFEQPQIGGFMDLSWPGVCIFEMKAPAEADRLDKHREQAMRYWRESSSTEKNIEAPRYVVLCAFRKLEIWEPGHFPKAPRLTLDLIDLPDQYDALLFLAGQQPVFVGTQADVTRKAVLKVTDLYAQLTERHAADLDVLQDFLLQAVWSMFAEDLGQIPGHRFSQLVDQLIANTHRSSADDLGNLFATLNDPAPKRPEHGLYEGIPHANGGLFEMPAHVHLEKPELEVLRQACEFNWRIVQPSIFGSLLEGSLGKERQWRLGAHYTHEADIQKVIQPTIVEPWKERIENISSSKEAVAALDDLSRFVVLDPACGSGNFLYVAYRELRRLENRLREMAATLSHEEGSAAQGAITGLFFPLQNLRGIELDAFAVRLARVTIWMGHRLAVEELDLPEATLPLEDLSGIQTGDALRKAWPKADVIVGNPPFHGSQNLRQELGDQYVGFLQEKFKIGLKDYCVYWYRLAHDHLEPGHRAGLVGTNSISQGRARGASLDYIAKNGGVITDAISKQKWPGAAVVNVSIVNWVKEPDTPPTDFMLDGEAVEGISTRLTASAEALLDVPKLPQNANKAFQGPIPAGDFYLTLAEGTELRARPEAAYEDVVRPYLNGEDVTEDPTQRPRRYAIDFAFMPLEKAMAYPAALELVRAKVKPERDTNNDKGFREHWWRFGRPRVPMRKALAPLARYIAGNAQGKRFHFCWCDPEVCPSNLTNVFAFEDDYAMGILLSATHIAWATREGSTLRIDPRYTPTTAFATFPWPDPNQASREAIAGFAEAIIDRRQQICLDRSIGLTELYNQVDEGAWADLKKLHDDLDKAVARAYGWSATIAQDGEETNAQLRALNAGIVAGEREYKPFG